MTQSTGACEVSNTATGRLMAVERYPEAVQYRVWGSKLSGLCSLPRPSMHPAKMDPIVGTRVTRNKGPLFNLGVNFDATTAIIGGRFHCDTLRLTAKRPDLPLRSGIRLEMNVCLSRLSPQSRPRSPQSSRLQPRDKGPGQGAPDWRGADHDERRAVRASKVGAVAIG
jgi:hypothetical protein